jgi:hypothetical protein
LFDGDVAEKQVAFRVLWTLRGSFVEEDPPPHRLLAEQVQLGEHHLGGRQGWGVADSGLKPFQTGIVLAPLKAGNRLVYIIVILG